MYPSVILPTAPLVSSSSSSLSPTANVGISLGSSWPTNTPPLTPAKSRTSFPAKLSTPPTARSPLSKMVVRASRVQSIPGQIQRSQLRVDRAKETSTSVTPPIDEPSSSQTQDKNLEEVVSRFLKV
ncbi:hypothetical protein LWI28_018566 [Acer negundo]|uniref:Uncharacterized protein n=1 Tax=Acer negundo TaxID=4023 RepID=A0AAD5IZV5_ACENE|nr:hypothetical protein LWI28_018566 [Acer negundo]